MSKINLYWRTRRYSFNLATKSETVLLKEQGRISRNIPRIVSPLEIDDNARSYQISNLLPFFFFLYAFIFCFLFFSPLILNFQFQFLPAPLSLRRMRHLLTKASTYLGAQRSRNRRGREGNLTKSEQKLLMKFKIPLF